MLKVIDIASDALGDDLALARSCDAAGRIIKKEQIADAQCAGDLVARARAKAEKLLEDARNRAWEDREEGFRQGVRAGVHAAFSPLRDLLVEVQALRQNMLADAAGRVRAAMEDLLGRAPTLAALLDTVIQAHLPQTPSALHICVPSHADVNALEAHCAAQGIDVRVEAAKTGDVFSAGWEGHLWEVRLDSLCGPSRPGTPPLADALREEGVRAICREALLAEADRLA